VGDISRIRSTLRWEPKVLAPELARIMVRADLERIGQPADGKRLTRAG
jgi:GDP-D-mannose dehydratase